MSTLAVKHLDYNMLPLFYQNFKKASLPVAPTAANRESKSQGQMGFLTFDPNPPANEVEDQAAPEEDDKQAELV